MKRCLFILWLLHAGILYADGPGSSPATAMLIPAGSTGIVGNVVRDMDVHWYRFLAAPTLVYTVRVDNVTLWDHEMCIRVFAEGDEVAATNSALHSSSGSSVVWTNTGGLRNYYVAVSPFLQFTTGTYVVVVNGNDGDTDGDGLPDAWETLYFFGATNAVVAATNAAGVSNWESFVTGTNPNDPGGALRITQSASRLKEVRWFGVPYAAYRVEASTNLLSADEWVTLGRLFTGSVGTSILYIDTTSTNRIQFYRLMYEMD